MAPSFSHFTLDDIAVLGIWLFETARHIYRRWQRSLARNWPLTNGAIEHVEVIAGQSQNVNLRYSYTQAGEWYSGEVIAPFDDSEQALDFVLRAKDKRILVSVNPDHPAESFVTPEQLAAAKAGLFPEVANEAPLTLAQPVLPLPVRPVAWLLAAASLCFLVIFLALHIAALRGRLLLTQHQLTNLIVAGIVAAIATASLEIWQHKKVRSSRPSMALRWPYYFFGVLTGFYFLAAKLYPDIRSPLFMRQMLCSVAEFICWGMLTSLYSVLTARKSSDRVAPALHAEAGT